MRAARGYILLEAMVGGAVVAIALSTCISIIAQYRAETSSAARKAEASSIAVTVADQLVSRPFGAVSNAAFHPVDAVDANLPTTLPAHPGFLISYTVTIVAPPSTPALAANTMSKIVVEVRYPTRAAPKTTSCLVAPPTGQDCLHYERLRRDQ